MEKRFVYCLRLLVVLALVCNVSGAFAETISTNTNLSSATTYSGDVTVNPGVTLTINSEVTIQGNLINNGGTIIVGEGGVLTVNGDVTNTSAYSTTEYTESAPSTSETTESTGNNKRNLIKTTTITRTPKIIIGSISVLNGGSITINNDFSNASNLSISSTEADKISKITVNGTFTSTTETITGYNTVLTTKVTQPQKKNPTWKNDGSSTSSESTTNNSISTTAVGSLNLSNGYLTVNDLVLNNGSTINYNTGTNGLTTNINGEDVAIESTIRVKNNATQNTGSDINLASGAKGSLIVQGTYTDNTTVQNTEYHPWYLKETKENRTFIIVTYQVVTDIEFITEPGFSFGVAKYKNETMASEVNNWLLDIASYFDLGGAMTNEQIQDKINEIKTNLETSGTIEKTKLDELISQVSSLLPIELTSFTVSATEHGYTFNWVTASEDNNDYFTLEFSENGEEFIAIDYIHGAGTTSQTSEYEYRWDAKPTVDILYFRLKQTDYNGEFTYSDILVYAPKKSHGATRTLYYGPLKLNVVDGQLQYIVE